MAWGVRAMPCLRSPRCSVLEGSPEDSVKGIGAGAVFTEHRIPF